MKPLSQYITEALISPRDTEKIESLMFIPKGKIRNESYPDIVKGEPKFEIKNENDGRHIIISNLIWYRIEDAVIEVKSKPLEADTLNDLIKHCDNADEIRVDISDVKDADIVLEIHYKSGKKSTVLVDCDIKKVKTFDPDKQ